MKDDPGSSVCPVCKNPRRSKAGGSFTQWISVCSCELTGLLGTELDPVEICKRCGKRVGAGRQGSLTQFIFRADTCQCDRPETDYFEKEKPAEEQFVIAPEIELDLADEYFPRQRYKALSLLGKGSTGSVYEARDRILDKKVTVKMLTSFDSPELLIRFQEEAKSTDRLNHPGIVKVLDFGSEEGNAPYMVLEYFDSVTLEEYLAQRGPLPWSQAAKILMEVARALAYAHEHGVLHRDIKPANILIGDQDVRVIDFGLTGIAAGSGPVGTPLYMAPDQGLGLEYDERSDIYSFGCVTFEMLSGRCPFVGGSSAETLRLHASSEVPLQYLDSVPDLDPELVSLLGRCLAKRPEDRFKNFAEIVEALERILSRIEIKISQESKVEDGSSSFAARNYSSGPKPVGAMVSLMFGLIFLCCLVLYVIAFGNGGSADGDRTAQLAATPSKLADLSVPPDEHVFQSSLKVEKDDNGGFIASGREIADEALKPLEGRKDIVALKIDMADRFTGSGIAYLEGSPLKSVEILSSAFDDNGAEVLSRFPTLRRLNLKVTSRLTEKGMAALGKLKNLEMIQFWNMALPSNCCQVIESLKSVHYVDLGNSSRITLADAKRLASMKKLAFIKLSGTVGVDDSFGPVLARSKIKSFLLNGTSISLATVELLSKRKETDMIRVSIGGDITIQGLRRLKKAHPKIKYSAVDEYNTAVPI
ncbi:MAG: serine/threonine protein kinase [Candidatus Obscuribacterales bacterium]|nr:serine/threonine protein kinase [Candidatus Obscuribacterales bacterium]